MATPGSHPERQIHCRFGPFEFNSARLELRRRGVRVPLTGQPLQILSVLLREPANVVTRDRLRESLWPGDVHLDFDGALNTAVKRLRQALEDTGALEKYIETLPRTGYRFVAPVETIQPPPPAENPAIAPPVVAADLPRSLPPTRWRWLWPAVAAVGLCAIAMALFWRAASRREPLAVWKSTFLTSFPGEQVAPALSPSGVQVAFSWADPAHAQEASLYLTSSTGLGLHRLTAENAGDFAPAWSSDGSQIAFVRQSGASAGRASVFVIPSAGGPERRVAATDGRYTAWVPGSNAVMVADRLPQERDFQLLAVSLSTGERTPVTTRDEHVDGWERFSFSPNGRTLGYTAWTGSQGPAEIFVRSAAGGAPRQITHLGSSLRGWCWLPDSDSILVVSSAPGVRRLFVVHLADPHLTLLPLIGAGDDVFQPTAVTDGNEVEIAFSQQRLTSNLYSFSIVRDSRGLPSHLSEPRCIAASTRATANPRISPDGRRLAFVSNRLLFNEIWLSDADGLNPHPLTSFNSDRIEPGSPQWSPDGTYIAFSAREDDITDLYVAPADGSAVTRLTHGHFDVLRPSWSHDGKSIYFARRDTTVAPPTLYKIAARAAGEQSAPTPLFGLEGMEPMESPEGGTLYFLPGIASSELWSVSLAGGKPGKLIDHGISHGWWTPAPGGIYSVDLSKPDSPVYYFELATRTTRLIGHLPHQPSLLQPGLSVFRDTLWTDWIDTLSFNLVRADLRPSRH